MPTGYTQHVIDNPEISAAEFLMRVATGFGAYIDKRDDNLMDAPLEEIKKYRPTRWSYYQKKLDAARQELRDLKDMSFEERTRRMLADYKKSQEYRIGETMRREQLARIYDRLIEEIEGWSPPTEKHIELKTYALKQLHSSKEWDCDLDSDYIKPLPEITDEREATIEWYKNERATISESIAYNLEALENEEERTKERVKWIEDLIHSLKILE